MSLNDEIVEKKLCKWSKKRNGYNEPYSVCYNATFSANIFETTIKLAEIYNISIKEAIMVGVDVIAKLHLEHYFKIEDDPIEEAFKMLDEKK